MTLQDRIRLFPRKFWPTLVMVLALAAGFGSYVYFEKQIDRANQRRQISILLADQLRQSSDDLTRMARTYVATGDPRYKAYYQDILDIREARKPRPPGYFNIYWDLVLADGEAPRAEGGQAAPLLELIRAAGSPEDELRKLAEAKENSDGLTAVEFEAMKLVETAGPDAVAARARALLMVHDAGYHHAKAAIMRPINEAYALMDKRTADEVEQETLATQAIRGPGAHSHVGIPLAAGSQVLGILNIAWNFVMPKFGLPQLNFLETVALVIVVKALVGFWGKG